LFAFVVLFLQYCANLAGNERLCQWWLSGG